MELLLERPYVPLDEGLWTKCGISSAKFYLSEWREMLDLLCDTDLVYSYFAHGASMRSATARKACLRQWLIAAARSHQASSDTPQPENEVAQRFDRYMNQWRRETWFMSSVKKRTANLNYLLIISLGKSAIPFILTDLKQRGDHWFLALRVLAEEDPSNGSEDFNWQREAWLTWGARKGYI